jgi:hypothetical protein
MNADAYRSGLKQIAIKNFSGTHKMFLYCSLRIDYTYNLFVMCSAREQDLTRNVSMQFSALFSGCLGTVYIITYIFLFFFSLYLIVCTVRYLDTGYVST